MMKTILEAAWVWFRVAGARALRTALVTLVPLLPLVWQGQDVQRTVSVVGMAGIASLVTSLAGLPELDGTGRRWWHATLIRAGKTLGQVLAASITTAILVTDVSWASVLWSAFGAAAGTVLLAVIAALPEADE